MKHALLAVAAAHEAEGRASTTGPSRIPIPGESLMTITIVVEVDEMTISSDAEGTAETTITGITDGHLITSTRDPA